MKDAWAVLVVLITLVVVGFMLFDTTGWILSLFFKPSPQEMVLKQIEKPELYPSLERIDEVIKVAEAREKDGFQKGICVLVYDNDQYFEEKTRILLNHLVSLNVNSVNLTFPIYMDNWISTNVYIDEKLTPSDENIRIFITEAKKRNLKVMVRPIIDEEVLYRDGKWRGSISPSNREAWFQNYGEIILKYAIISEQEDVEIFAIGTELTSMERDTKQWYQLIDEIRNVYNGQLTYCVNHYKFDQNVEFWDQLDIIAIDAFFPLDAPAQPTVDELIDAWQIWIDGVKALQEIYEKPIVFAETGVVSQTGAHQAPWRPNHGTLLNLKAQSVYYTATFQATVKEIDGLYWWFVTLDLPNDPENDHDYNPLGKPAEKVIADYYKRFKKP